MEGQRANYKQLAFNNPKPQGYLSLLKIQVALHKSNPVSEHSVY